jgi:gluconate 2-dehydrogenase gamma chain
MEAMIDLTRRGLVVGLTAWIAEAQEHAHETVDSGVTRLEVLDAGTAAEVEALTSQIIPSDDGPGAREAGVIYFIDRALATFEADQRGAYHKGLDEVQKLRHKMYPGSASIAALAASQQIELLRAMEKSEFFELLRKHTVWGFVGSPIYGGNRGKAGWKHIGFDDQMQFEPPFGYYDAEVLRGKKS